MPWGVPRRVGRLHSLASVLALLLALPTEGGRRKGPSDAAEAGTLRGEVTAGPLPFAFVPLPAEEQAVAWPADAPGGLVAEPERPPPVEGSLQQFASPPELPPPPSDPSPPLATGAALLSPEPGPPLPPPLPDSEVSEAPLPAEPLAEPPPDIEPLPPNFQPPQRVAPGAQLLEEQPPLADDGGQPAPAELAAAREVPAAGSAPLGGLMSGAMAREEAERSARRNHGIVSRFMQDFAKNMKYAVLADSQGDMPEEERLRQMREIERSQPPEEHEQLLRAIGANPEAQERRQPRSVVEEGKEGGVRHQTLREPVGEVFEEALIPPHARHVHHRLRMLNGNLASQQRSIQMLNLGSHDAETAQSSPECEPDGCEGAAAISRVELPPEPRDPQEAPGVGLEQPVPPLLSLGAPPTPTARPSILELLHLARSTARPSTLLSCFSQGTGGLLLGVWLFVLSRPSS